MKITKRIRKILLTLAIVASLFSSTTGIAYASACSHPDKYEVYEDYTITQYKHEVSYIIYIGSIPFLVTEECTVTNGWDLYREICPRCGQIGLISYPWSINPHHSSSHCQ